MRFRLAAGLAAALVAFAGVRLDYDPSRGLEPHDPRLGLGFFATPTGTAAVSGPLVTVDADTRDYRGGAGRYYRRQFTNAEFNQTTNLRITVTVRVLSSEGSPAATCLQFTTPEGRTFGLGFLKGEAVLYADGGGPLPQFKETYSGQDWLLEPQVLARRRLDITLKHTYVLELRRANLDLIRLSIAGTRLAPMTAKLSDLKTRAAVPGLLFGHPVVAGTGSAEWYHLTVETTGRRDKDLPRRIGNRRQLFLDDWMIESSENLRREPGKPVKHPANPVLRPSMPWDAARVDLYGNAVWDSRAKLLRLFYNCQSWPRAVAGSDKPVKTVQLCYAESSDRGLSWRKPLFGTVPFDGVPETNIVYRPRYMNLAGPFVLFDERDPDPGRRYKLFTSDYGDAPAKAPAPPPGIDVAFSPDGVHWRPSSLNPVLPLLSDTAQSVVWDARIGRYVAFVRMRPRGFGRAVGRSESADFEHWSPPELVFATRRHEFYAMGVTSYEGLYIGTPWIIYNDKKDPALAPPIMEAELGFSRDGWTWTRLFPGSPFLGVGAPGSPDEKQIRMSSSLIVLDDRVLCLYAMSRDVHVSDMRVEVGLATLRLDGFASMTAGETEGTLVTKPFVVEGTRLEINADASAGEAAIEVLDARGRPIPGYEARHCRGIRGDGLRLSVAWDSHHEFARLRGKVVRLRFVLRRARLYSFQVVQ
jgi:hypothetical protein